MSDLSKLLRLVSFLKALLIESSVMQSLSVPQIERTSKGIIIFKFSSFQAKAGLLPCRQDYIKYCDLVTAYSYCLLIIRRKNIFSLVIPMLLREYKIIVNFYYYLVIDISTFYTNICDLKHYHMFM